MNQPFNPPDVQSQSLGSLSPVPSTLDSASSAVASAGYEWVEFIFTLSGNGGGSPITELTARFEYRDPVSNTWEPVTVEDIDPGTGSAPQSVYLPSSPVLSGNAVWRVPVLSHGAEMRARPYASAGTPAGGSAVAISAYRR